MEIAYLHTGSTSQVQAQAQVHTIAGLSVKRSLIKLHRGAYGRKNTAPEIGNVKSSYCFNVFVEVGPPIGLYVRCMYRPEIYTAQSALPECKPGSV